MQLIPHWDQFPTLTFREKVAYLAYEFAKMPQIDCPVTHIFSHYSDRESTYIREMRIPEGTLFLGRAHTHGHRCELLEGALVQILPDGTKRLVEAPFAVDTVPGFHMVLYALTDVIGRTIHPNPTGSEDIDELEADIFESPDVLKALGAVVAQRLLPSDIEA